MSFVSVLAPIAGRRHALPHLASLMLSHEPRHGEVVRSSTPSSRGGRRLEGHTMPQAIVCGVDQSDAAGAVANAARWLANRLNAVRVVDGMPATSGPGASR